MIVLCQIAILIEGVQIILKMHWLSSVYGIFASYGVDEFYSNVDTILAILIEGVQIIRSAILIQGVQIITE